MAREKSLQRARDGRKPAQKAADRAAADKQARRAVERGGDAQLIAERTRRVIKDRRDRRAADPDSPLKMLRVLTRAGRSVLVVDGEQLVRADALSEDEIRSHLGAGAEWVPHLEGRLLVLPDAGRPRGPARSHYAVPFGPVMKAAVGAEPASQVGAAAVSPTSTSEAAPVAIIDTGIAASTRSDGWLAGVTETDDNRDPLDALPPDDRLDLGAGHGTFVAGIIEQVEPGAEIRVYRALDSDGIGSEAAVASAMVLAAKEGAKIICLSLGLQTEDDRPPVGLQVAVEAIREQWSDVLVVAAAGNFGDRRPCWPAALKGVTAVGGLDRAMQLASWSSRGPWVDCSTIGEAVRSTFVPGTERDDVDPDPTPDVYPRDAWAVWSGTSFAAPQVAGAVAQLAMKNGTSPRDALAALLRGAPDEPDAGRKVEIIPPT